MTHTKLSTIYLPEKITKRITGRVVSIRIRVMIYWGIYCYSIMLKESWKEDNKIAVLTEIKKFFFAALQ